MHILMVQSIKNDYSLDGIRGMAFLIVIIQHISGNNPAWSTNLIGVGRIGVWLFFVLSSFLLTNYFLNDPQKARDPLEWVNYLIRRFFRIYPLYAVVLMINFLCRHNINSMHDLYAHLFLRQGMNQWWTMPVELKYYLILPFAILLMVYLSKFNVAVVIACGVLFTLVHQMFFPESRTDNVLNTIQYIPVFFMGSVAAVIHQKMKVWELKESTRILMDIFCILLLAAMVISTPYFMRTAFPELPKEYLVYKFVYFGIAWSLFIIFTVHGKWCRKVFSTSVMRYFGKISFSGYLIHWLIMQYVIIEHYHKLTWASGILTLGIIMIVSTILYYVIERPCMKINLLKIRRHKQIEIATQ